MDNTELKEKGEQVAVAFALSGKKQGLEDQIKAQNGIISDNNSQVASLQTEVNINNALAKGEITSLTKELGEVSDDLNALLDALKKEGYTLPIGTKKSKTITM